MLKKIVMMILFGMSSITVHASSDRTRNTILPIAIPVRQVPSQDIISLATNQPILPI
ncbi:MAG: hypothetical protein JO129_01760, partial [Candidatus Dependentiae bacterium]|nr:hypothetical protein [Candidatus Dependentiae bacterium]